MNPEEQQNDSEVIEQYGEEGSESPAEAWAPSATRRWLTAVLVLVAALLLGYVLFALLMSPGSHTKTESVPVDDGFNQKVYDRLQESMREAPEYDMPPETVDRLETSLQAEGEGEGVELSGKAQERLSDSAAGQ